MLSNSVVNQNLCCKGPVSSRFNIIVLQGACQGIHSEPFGSTLILVLSSTLPFITQSKTVLCPAIHSLILLFDHLCHSAFQQVELYSCSIYSLSYWVQGFLRVFSLDPPLPGMSEWCTQFLTLTLNPPSPVCRVDICILTL